MNIGYAMIRPGQDNIYCVKSSLKPNIPDDSILDIQTKVYFSVNTTRSKIEGRRDEERKNWLVKW